MTVAGPVSVVALLKHFDLNRESVLVIRNDTLVPGDVVLADADEVEIRPVISRAVAPAGTPGAGLDWLTLIPIIMKIVAAIIAALNPPPPPPGGRT